MSELVRLDAQLEIHALVVLSDMVYYGAILPCLLTSSDCAEGTVL